MIVSAANLGHCLLPNEPVSRKYELALILDLSVLALYILYASCYDFQ
jgi:hypothetical protein